MRNLTLVWRPMKTQIIHLATTVPHFSTWATLTCGHAKERPSASEEVVARPRNILARPRNIFARPRTFLARPSPIQVNPSYFSSFERRLMVNETF